MSTQLEPGLVQPFPKPIDESQNTTPPSSSVETGSKRKVNGARVQKLSDHADGVHKAGDLARQSLKQAKDSEIKSIKAPKMHLFGLGNLAKGLGNLLIKKIAAVFRRFMPKYADMRINSPNLILPGKPTAKSIVDVNRDDISNLLLLDSNGNRDIIAENFNPERVTDLLPRPLTAVLSDGTGQSLEDTRAKLRDTLLAFQTVRQKHGIYLNGKQAKVLAAKTEKLLDEAKALAAEGKSTEKVNTQLQKLYAKTLDDRIKYQNKIFKERGQPLRDAKEIGVEFKSQIATMRGRHVPSKMIHHVHIPYNGQTIRYTEQTTTVNTDLSAQYLQKKGLDEQATFAKAQKGGIRPSAMKTEKEVQGTPISGNIHVVKNEEGKVIEWTARSGAWATHGRTPKSAGSRTLETIAKKLQESLDHPGRASTLTDKELTIVESLQKKYVSDPKNKGKPLPQNFDAHVIHLELKERTTLTTAQALPLVYGSLKMLVSQEKSVENALKAGSFLHMEQSLLSDLVASERAMIEDMAHTIKNLNENVSIEFMDGPVSEEDQMSVNDEGKITLKFSLNDVPEGLREKVKDHSEPLKLTTVFFTQGLNEQQDIQALKGGKSQLQEDINFEGIKALQAYEAQLDSESPVVPGLVQQWMHGEYQFKDTALINKLNEVVTDLGGGKGVVCKSGKDRTGSEVNTINRMAIEKDLQGKEEGYKMDEKTREELKDSLSNGPSYAITRQGTDHAGYAFNDFQAGTFPDGIDIPDNRFFGSGPT